MTITSNTAPRLSNGQPFPALTFPRVGGGELTLPDDLAGSYGVVLLYRGAWCPYCNGQLAGFARAAQELASLGIEVVAVSVDDEATSAELVRKRKIPYPVGHSADLRAVVRATGAYANDDPPHLQSTGFVLAPDGTIMTAVYSSGAIGRLVADDVLGLVRYVQTHG